MRISQEMFTRFGEDVTIDGNAAKAFLSPVNAKKHDNIKKPTAVGVKNGAEYLLLTDSALALCGGEEIVCGGRHFLSLRAEPIYYCGEISHYEAVLRPKGGSADV